MLFRRSAEAQRALDSRDKRLGARLRALMLMAEGKPVDQVAGIAAALGAPADALEQLRAMGFVETAAAPAGARSDGAIEADGPYERFRNASGMFREIAADVMGMKAFFFILKVEKAATLGDLLRLLPELMPAVLKKRGAGDAAVLEAQLRASCQGEG